MPAWYVVALLGDFALLDELVEIEAKLAESLEAASGIVAEPAVSRPPLVVLARIASEFPDKVNVSPSLLTMYMYGILKMYMCVIFILTMKVLAKQGDSSRQILLEYRILRVAQIGLRQTA